MTRGAGRVYPGARPFDRVESSLFFGRTAEAARLGEEWLQNRVTFLSGPAGMGKSSLLTAGVLPLVESSKVSVLPVGGLSGSARCPVAALRKHNPYTLALLRSWSGADAATHLAGATVDDFVRQHAQGRDADVRILAAIDQADDLFAGPEARQPIRRRFLDELAIALREQPTLHLLVTIRSDVLPRITEVLGDGVQFHLDPLDIENAREAVEKPGFFAADAAHELVGSMRTSRIVSGPGRERLVISDQIEPALLQVACAWLWESLQTQFSTVTLRELERHSEMNVDAALAGYCSVAIAAVATSHKIPVGWLRSWLIDTFITEVGDLDTATEGQPETAGAPTTVARALEDRYLLRAQAGQPPGSRLYELISDRLIEPLRQAPIDAPPLGSPDEYLRAAERARITGEHDLAAGLAAQVFLAAPDDDLRLHAEAYSLLGDLAYEQGHLEEAETRYQEAAKLYEASGNKGAVARLFAAIAQTYIDRNRLADALNHLHAAVNRTSDATVQVELSWVMEALAQQAAQASPFRISTA